jgi:hypothetical protein
MDEPLQSFCQATILRHGGKSYAELFRKAALPGHNVSELLYNIGSLAPTLAGNPLVTIHDITEYLQCLAKVGQLDQSKMETAYVADVGKDQCDYMHSG